MPEPAVTAVVVTWNRRELLVESLTATLAQTLPPRRILVVDNASTDGTAELLAGEFPGIEAIRTQRNLGGAGGFALGIRAALDDPDCDAIWLMDDDTVPNPTALQELVSARESAGSPPAAVVASRVVWSDGRDHPMNTPRAWAFAARDWRRRARVSGCVPIRSASFVSVVVDAALARERGLPIADYFLWNDDFEYTTRLVRGGIGLSCPSSVVVHKTAAFGSTDRDPGDRFRYEVRNKVWLFTRSRSLNPAEKLLFTGSTMVRWLRTVAMSSARGPLWRGLRHGLAEGLRHGPRATDDILRGEPDGVAR